MDERSVEDTCDGTNALADLQDIAGKLADLAQQIKAITATPLGEAIAHDDGGEVPPPATVE
ncbi:MAG TPA: hypothetical protein VGO04_07680 [Ensifer sp.]|uniref:hypothetical protein n=1 Tax=Ensifer sp. TaxID=1872086 RepID=UPI002E12CD82|nr:hypothetical protein [Ensifer sp.]